MRDHDLLASAAARPFQTLGSADAYPTIFDKAAALFHSLVNNHAFHNGNKRVGLIAAQVLLAHENLWLDHSSDEEMFEFTRQAASHELTATRADELRYISEWFDANSRRIVKGEHPMKFGELKEALKRFGFELGAPEGDLIDIFKGWIQSFTHNQARNPGVPAVPYGLHRGTPQTAQPDTRSGRRQRTILRSQRCIEHRLSIYRAPHRGD